jgi:hypothetical protein
MNVISSPNPSFWVLRDHAKARQSTNFPSPYSYLTQEYMGHYVNKTPVLKKISMRMFDKYDSAVYRVPIGSRVLPAMSSLFLPRSAPRSLPPCTNILFAVFHLPCTKVPSVIISDPVRYTTCSQNSHHRSATSGAFSSQIGILEEMLIYCAGR